mmetsp:Transcript_44583/g.106328  ORF Transcript_44583/g.106328 Transcript_44583/m.106328 type:complete len:241 (+) Transcript_44583:122-844(+)
MRWSTVIPSTENLQDQIRELVAAFTKVMSAVLPADYPEIKAQVLGLARSLGNQARAEPLQAAYTVAAVLITAVILGRLGRGKKVTVMDALSEDPDLSVFVGFWQALPQDGPWEKPDLSKDLPPSKDAKDKAKKTLPPRLIVFAPVNSAFEKARGEILNLNEEQWRRLLVTHVAHSEALTEVLEAAETLVSSTNSQIPLACIRDTFSDGSVKVRAPIETSNGLIYRIDAVLQPQKLPLAGR